VLDSSKTLEQKLAVKCLGQAVDKQDIIADFKLVGSRILYGQSEPEITTHFTGRVRLVSGKPPIAQGEKISQPENAAKVDASQIYRLYFHGPAYQVIESAWRDADTIVAAFAQGLPANHEPAELPTAVSPRHIEMCFQTASLMGLAQQARMGLPYSFDELKVAALPAGEATKVFSVISQASDGAYDAKLVDEKGNVWMTLHGYRTMDLPDPVPTDLVQPLQQALQKAGA